MSTLDTPIETLREIAQRKGLCLNDACIAILAERSNLPRFADAGPLDRQRRELLSAAHDAIRAFEGLAD